MHQYLYLCLCCKIKFCLWCQNSQPPIVNIRMAEGIPYSYDELGHDMTALRADGYQLLNHKTIRSTARLCGRSASEIIFAKHSQTTQRGIPETCPVRFPVVLLEVTLIPKRCKIKNLSWVTHKGILIRQGVLTGNYVINKTRINTFQAMAWCVPKLTFCQLAIYLRPQCVNITP